MRLERTGALLGHARLEAVEVDAAPALSRDLAGEVDREPERVVEEERVLAVDVAATDELVEEIEATFERLAEALLLARDGAGDRLVFAHELRVRSTHHRDRRGDERGCHRLGRRRAGTHGARRAG